MKKILIACIILLSSFGLTYAKDGNTPKAIKVVVTEKIPGADCGENIGTEEYPRYECEVKKGTTGVVQILGYIIKWFAYLASLVGVLFIVYNGILYSMGGADQSLKDESKKRIVATLIGLALLFLSGAILQIIAPWIYK